MFVVRSTLPDDPKADRIDVGLDRKVVTSPRSSVTQTMLEENYDAVACALGSTAELEVVEISTAWLGWAGLGLSNVLKEEMACVSESRVAPHDATDGPMLDEVQREVNGHREGAGPFEHWNRRPGQAGLQMGASVVELQIH